MSLYKCPSCGWVGTVDSMESTCDESYDSETGDESVYGSIHTCPNCGFDLGEDPWRVDDNYLVTDEEVNND